MRDPQKRKYLTEEYEEAIDEYATNLPDYETPLITAVFLHDCRNLDEIFVVDSLPRVRRVAWQQTKHRLETDAIPEECESDDV